VTALLAAAPAAAGRKLPTTMGKVKVAEQYAPGDVAAPGCRLERRLGHGPFGEVWQAVTALPRRVALRIFRLDQYHRLVRPFRACRGLRALQHPHLLPYYRFWLKDADGQVVDDTQDVGGLGAPVELVAATALADSSLAEALAQQPAGLPVAALIGYLEEAARALDFLNQPHRLASGQTTAFSHRGLKPGNLLLAGGRVRVADFGLSYLLQVEEGWLNLWGKAYLAPEQILDWDQHHPQADQYSLAVTYYQLRTGRLPFATTDIVAVMQDIVMGKLDLTGVPAAERAVLERATSIFPADRFPGCLALIQELTQAVPQRPDSAALL
jgi:serine/threonine protein kinase